MTTTRNAAGGGLPGAYGPLGAVAVLLAWAAAALVLGGVLLRRRDA